MGVGLEGFHVPLINRMEWPTTKRGGIYSTLDIVPDVIMGRSVGCVTYALDTSRRADNYPVDNVVRPSSAHVAHLSPRSGLSSGPQIGAPLDGSGPSDQLRQVLQ